MLTRLFLHCPKRCIHTEDRLQTLTAQRAARCLPSRQGPRKSALYSVAFECPQPSRCLRHSGTRVLTQGSLEGASEGLQRPWNCLQAAGARPVNLSVAQTPKVMELPSVIGAEDGGSRA